MKATVSRTARTNLLAISLVYGGGVAFIILALSFLIAAQDEAASDPILVAVALTFSMTICLAGILLKLTVNCLKQDFMDKLDLQQMDAKQHTYWVECIVVVEDRKAKTVIIQRGLPKEIDLNGNLRPDASVLIGEPLPGEPMDAE